MTFKLTLRNKYTGSIEPSFVEAANETEARKSIEDPSLQIITCRPLRTIGSKPQKQEKPVYINIHRLRKRVERDLENRQMGLGRHSPEAIAKEQAKLQAELDAELNSWLYVVIHHNL